MVQKWEKEEKEWKKRKEKGKKHCSRQKRYLKPIKPCAKDNIELTFCSKIIKNEEMTKQFIAVVHEDMCISKIKKNIILALEKTKK